MRPLAGGNGGHAPPRAIRPRAGVIAISCTAHESLSAQALQNSRITYAGNPPQKILNSGIGSTIRKQRAQQYARHHRYTTHPRTL